MAATPAGPILGGSGLTRPVLIIGSGSTGLALAQGLRKASLDGHNNVLTSKSSNPSKRAPPWLMANTGGHTVHSL
ncbi:hypothetical protein J1614_002261 [Plenodomus biglobosus]|nr:hypothetical protein J1614_002261 [Plenodomus biglobosus]